MRFHISSQQVFIILIFTLTSLASLLLPNIAIAETVSWTKAKNMPFAKDSNSASLLSNGKVLVVGNNSNSGLPEGAPPIQFIYDPTTDHWTTTTSLAEIFPGYSINITLNNGNALVIGYPSEDNPSFAAQLYNPQTSLWASAGLLEIPNRGGYAAVKLSNGKVLVTGGIGGINSEYNDRIFIAEIYDPATNSWSKTGSNNISRQFHTLTLLNNGKVLETGFGANSEGYFSEFTAEIYDPASGGWTTTASMIIPRSEHTATVLTNGKVLVTGGSYINEDNKTQITATSELYDPTTGQWTQTGGMNHSRRNHRATLLKNGKVLISGGDSGDLINNDFILNTAEMYDPASGTWSLVQNMNHVRSNHSSTLLPDGRVLVVGGEVGPQCCQTPQSITAEIYSPTAVIGGVLNVPYFSQNVLPWGSSEYDHTKLLGVTGYNTTMDRWGCAVTSAAMILNYHNIKQFADGKAIDPGSLNEWLKNNKGYDYGYNKSGWYSSIKWWTVGTLTAQLYKVGKAPYKLEWKKTSKSFQTDNLITQDLTVGNSFGKIPSVLLVKNSKTTGHYVVAKGVLTNTFAINDPEWNHPDLTSFNNTYNDVHRYVPSKTDLSYITAVVNPNIEILITDSQGRRTGKTVNNGEIEVFNEIPEATYTFEPPIVNSSDDESMETLGTGVNQFLLPNPDNGDYRITLSSLYNDTYTLNMSALEVDGDSVENKSVGALSPTTQNSFVVSYSQTEPSLTNKEVTFTGGVYVEVHHLRSRAFCIIS